MDFHGAKQGCYGGIFADKDIAFEFGIYISPEVRLLLIRGLND